MLPRRPQEGKVRAGSLVRLQPSEEQQAAAIAVAGAAGMLGRPPPLARHAWITETPSLRIRSSAPPGRRWEGGSESHWVNKISRGGYLMQKLQAEFAGCFDG